jgi:hypothetical protein
MTQAGFFSFLGKALALAVIADQAYAVSKTGSPSTLLQPENFQALLGEVDVVFAPPTQPAPAVGPAEPVLHVPASPAPIPPAGVSTVVVVAPPPPVSEQG